MFANNFGKQKNICCGLVSVVEGVQHGHYPIPLTSVHVNASVIHAVAQVEITQNYVNEEEKPIEAIYYFPVDPDGAVTNFTAELDGRLIKGTVKPREEAQEAYEKAIANKTTSFLGEEIKADIFKLRVGFLKPGAHVKIIIEYITEVKNEPGTNNIRFYIPTTIAPRYVSATETDEQAIDIRKMKFSSSSPATLSLKVRVSMQGGIKSIESPTHKVAVEKEKPVDKNDVWQKAIVELSDGKTTDMDRDFVLTIEPEDRHKPRLYSEKIGGDDGSIAVMVHLLPSFKFDEQKTELIFVLDRSGSMQGKSIDLAKKALSLFLHSIPADCYFNVVGFGSRYEFLFPTSVKYDDGSLKKAKAYAKELRADFGGTEILEPLKKLYEGPEVVGYLKQIFILTDGEVSNTKAVFGIVQANAHKARVFTLGIGDAASHDLVEGVAKVGCGKAAFVTYNESMEEKVLNQLKNALQPSLTDIELEWEGLAPVEQQPTPVLNKKKTLLGYNKPIESKESLNKASFPKIRQSPKRIPPVYDGSQLLVFGLFRNDECPKSVLITAQSPDGPLTVRVEHLPSSNLDGNSAILHRLAAIKLVRELEIEASALNIEDSEAEKKLKNEIVEIACQNGITSRYTSFVVTSDANDDKPSAENWVLETRYVPTQIAHGWHRVCSSSVAASQLHRSACRKISSFPACALRLPPPRSSSLVQNDYHEPYKYQTSAPSHSNKSNNFRSVVFPKRANDSIPNAKESSAPVLGSLMQLISLQSYDGSFTLNEALVPILGKPLKEMVAESNKHNLANEVFATALALSFFVTNLADEKEKWELIVAKARKWLTKAVQPENLDTIVKLAFDFLKA